MAQQKTAHHSWKAVQFLITGSSPGELAPQVAAGSHPSGVGCVGQLLDLPAMLLLTAMRAWVPKQYHVQTRSRRSMEERYPPSQDKTASWIRLLLGLSHQV